MIVTLDHDKHEYTDDRGKVIPGFSEILSCVGTRTKNEDGTYSHWNSISGGEFCSNETAQNFGHAFHDYAKYDLLGIKCDYDPVLQPWINGFKSYVESNSRILSREDLHVEISLGSKVFGYAGTPDLFYIDGKVLHVFDWKTCTKLELLKVRMQLAAYAELIQEQFGRVSKVIRHAVRFYENGYQEDIRKGHPEDWYQFQGILNTYKLAA